MGGSKKAQKGQRAETQEKEGQTSYPSFFFLNTTGTEIEDLYMSGMEEARLRWLELSEDEGVRNEAKR